MIFSVPAHLWPISEQLPEEGKVVSVIWGQLRTKEMWQVVYCTQLGSVRYGEVIVLRKERGTKTSPSGSILKCQRHWIHPIICLYHLRGRCKLNPVLFIPLSPSPLITWSFDLD